MMQAAGQMVQSMMQPLMQPHMHPQMQMVQPHMVMPMEEESESEAESQQQAQRAQPQAPHALQAPVVAATTAMTATTPTATTTGAQQRAMSAPPSVPFQFEDVTMIARSASSLKSLARQRLSECLEFLDEKLDAAYTAELTSVGLLALVYAYTRLKPLVRICDLSAFDKD